MSLLTTETAVRQFDHQVLVNVYLRCQTAAMAGALAGMHCIVVQVAVSFCRRFC